MLDLRKVALWTVTLTYGNLTTFWKGIRSWLTQVNVFVKLVITTLSRPFGCLATGNVLYTRAGRL